MSNKTVDKLNEILRGERSAAETYVQVLDKIGSDPNSDKIRETKSEHLKAVQELKSVITRLGGTPSDTSGAWGSWAKTVAGTSKIFGDTSAINALQEGEEHGLKLYKELAEEKTTDPQINELATTYISAQQRHIQTLEQIKKTIK